MKKIIIAACIAILSSCSNSNSENKVNDSNSAAAIASNSMDGTWVYEKPNSTNSTIKGMGVKISGSDIAIISMYAYQQSSGYVIYFRKNVGTFVKDGNKLTLNYTYETCNQVGTEVVYFKQNGENATASNSDGSIIFTMKRYANNDPNSPFNATMIEDKGCTILSKIQNQKQTRSIASDLDKSIFSIKKLEK